MKNLLFTILLCAFSHGAMFSQTDKDKTAAFQFSFLPPLSTNGIQSYRYTNDASFNLLAGISKNEKAFAFAGFSNIVLRDANGLLFAGLFNYTGRDGKGLSLSGLMNMTKKQYSGFQLGGVANYAGKMKGFQFAGIANIAGDVTGFQFGGIVNKARNVSGVQFAGIINLAYSSDCPIGLINIIKDGEMGVAVTYNETGSTMITFRSGGKFTYGIIGLGYNHKISSWYTTEAGLGAHIHCFRWLKINNELKVASIGNASTNPTFTANYSLLPAFRLTPHIELFGGPSINYMNAKSTESSDLLPKHSIWEKNGDTRLQRGYIGYQAGIQYIF